MYAHVEGEVHTFIATFDTLFRRSLGIVVARLYIARRLLSFNFLYVFSTAASSDYASILFAVQEPQGGHTCTSSSASMQL
jgi:hypothetical protein